MNNHQNSAGKVLFQLAGTAAVVALILSISRLFLSTSDRGATAFYYAYNLAVSSQMSAFISVIAVGILLILIGSLLNKEYDIIGTPMVAGGVMSLIFITILAYFVQALDHNSGNSFTAELVLTLVIAVEWLMLVIYAWKSDDESVVVPQSTPAVAENVSIPTNTTPIQPPIQQNQNYNQPIPQAPINPPQNSSQNNDDDVI